MHFSFDRKITVTEGWGVRSRMPIHHRSLGPRNRPSSQEVLARQRWRSRPSHGRATPELAMERRAVAFVPRRPSGLLGFWSSAVNLEFRIFYRPRTLVSPPRHKIKLRTMDMTVGSYIFVSGTTPSTLCDFMRGRVQFGCSSKSH